VTVAGVDATNEHLWDRRTIDFGSDGRIVADLRDYSDVANQWLVNHTFPAANLSQADETFAGALAAQDERRAYLGNMTDTGAPSPLSYESYFGAVFDFSASSFAINPGQFTTVSVVDAGLGFDVSFSGGSAGANSFKATSASRISPAPWSTTPSSATRPIILSTAMTAKTTGRCRRQRAPDPRALCTLRVTAALPPALKALIMARPYDICTILGWHRPPARRCPEHACRM